MRHLLSAITTTLSSRRRQLSC